MDIPKIPKLSTVGPGEFFGKIMQSRDVTHLVHLSTKSFEVHNALNGYYNEIPELIDGIIESYQGKYGIVKISIEKSTDEDPIAYLESLAKYIDTNKERLFKESWILNQIDGVSELVYSTLYKLKNLK